MGKIWGIAFKKHSDKELLKLYSKIMGEMRSRRLVRSSNNPLGDYAEKIISEKLGLQLIKGSNKGFDAVDPKGIRYQIKARRITAPNTSRQLGVIRNLGAKDFDYLLAAIFDAEFNLKELWRIPHGLLLKKHYATFRKHQNGHIVILSGQILKDKAVKDLTKSIGVIIES